MEERNVIKVVVTIETTNNEPIPADTDLAFFTDIVKNVWQSALDSLLRSTSGKDTAIVKNVVVSED